MLIVVYIYVFIFSFVLTFLLVPLARKLAIRWNIHDHPGERKIHQTPKPYLGGVAIFLSFFVTILFNIVIYFLLISNPDFQNQLPLLAKQLPYLINAWPKLAAILGGSLIIVGVGVIDDIKSTLISPRLKLLLQTLAALIAIYFGISISFFPYDWMDWLFSVIWIVVITNSFNLLDNMDGLSSGVAALAALIFFSVSIYQGQVFMGIILIIFVGSVLGFLRYNYYPSTIFMGDAGSLFLGYILGTLTISASYVTAESASLLPALMPVFILSIPIFDTLSVVIIRLKEKRPIFVGDKRHLSHRLVDMGFSQRHAVNTIYLLTIAIGLVSFLLPSLSVGLSILVFIQIFIILIIISILMFVGKRKNHKQE
jgi:UDP-GlcNAc:undecaprenyl-phosphate GlcNAc-1-phosphate transferase